MVSVFEHLQRMYKSVDHRYASFEKSFRKEVYVEKGVSFESVDEIPVDETVEDDSLGEVDGALTIVPNLESSNELTRKTSHLSLYRKPTKNLQALSPKGMKQPSSPSSPSKSPRTPKSPSRSTLKDSFALSPLSSPLRLLINMNSSSFRRNEEGRESPVSILRSSTSRISPMKKRSMLDSPKSKGLKYISSFHMNSKFSTSQKIPMMSEKEASRFDKILNDPNASPEFKSSLILYFLTTYLTGRFFTASQMTVIMDLFSVGMVAKTSFGSYRVELLIFLFGKIIDLHNFNQILRVLTAEVI